MRKYNTGAAILYLVTQALTISIAVFNEILCPTDIISGWMDSLVLLKAAPHTFPDFPLSSTASPPLVSSAFAKALTFFYSFEFIILYLDHQVRIQSFRHQLREYR